MTKLAFFTGIAVFLIGCGKGKPVIQCTWGNEPTVSGTAGTYEEIKCPTGEFVMVLQPKYKPGDDKVTHIEFTCARRVQSCSASVE